MRIGFWGDGPWGHSSLQRLLQNELFEVVFVTGRASVHDKILEQMAKGSHIPFFRPQNANDEAFLKALTSFVPDINVSMSYDQIIKKDLIFSAPSGFINCHAGALPFYRGRNILNWAIINGERQFGITVHYVDEGIDTGDIIKQEFIDILEEDNYRTVLKKAEENCPRVLEEALIDIVSRRAKRVPQKEIHPIGFYCGRRTDGDEVLHWNWPSERIHNFVRGITLPAPCAKTWLKNREIRITETSLIPEAPAYIGTPGEVVGRGPEGNYVKTGDTVILMTSVLMGKNQEDCLIPSFPIGTRFSSFLRD